VLHHPSLLTHHGFTPSLPYHHMHVYLTILLQVQLVDWSLLISNMTPLLVLGQSPAPLLFFLILPALKLLQILVVSLMSTASPLFAANFSTTPSASLNLVVDLSSYPLQQGTSLPSFLLHHHPLSANTLWFFDRGSQRQQI